MLASSECCGPGTERKEQYPPASWTNAIANTIKAATSQQLIIDGTAGVAYGGQVAAGLTIPNIDMLSDHAYPRNLALIQSEASRTNSAQKAFLIGEVSVPVWLLRVLG